MFKVSFKENSRFPVKKVQRFNDDRVTVVTLKGVAQLPVFLQYFFPPKIFDWMETLKNVNAEVTMSNMFITVTGKSICAKEDKLDNKLGERIAEARAKVYLYKFMYKLCQRLLRYFTEELFGKDIVPVISFYRDNTLFRAEYKYHNLYKDEQKHLNILLGHESNAKSTSQP